MDTSIIIAALNEERTIARAIERVRPFADEIIVVDGHSSDQTAAIAEREGARVIQDNRRGKGDAVRCGAMAAKNDILVFIDADLSHVANDIPAMVAPIANDEADLVIASRMRGGSDELHSSVAEAIRLIGSTIITQAINLRFSVRLTDYQNGYRAICRSTFLALDLQENITTIEQEMAIKALRLGYRVMEIPSHEFARTEGVSKINVLKVSYLYIWQLVRDLSCRSRKRAH
jgi:glycosyltransferase involved in cell wall biosynthesis